MPPDQTSAAEQIQQAVVRLLATSPAGQNLRLIGGFRYRFLDQSARISADIDYHWDGDLQAKQSELVELFGRRLLPEIKRRLGYDGDVRCATGPEAMSPAVSTVELAFYRPGVAYSRIEIPVDLTRIICLDPLVVRTAAGVIYPTASDADLIESKVIALLNRPAVEHRDFCDLFLFASHFAPNAAQRMRTKLARLSLDSSAVNRRLHALRDGRAYHVRAIDALIGEQLDDTAAANLRAAGGAAIVFDTVWDLLRNRLKLGEEGAP